MTRDERPSAQAPLGRLPWLVFGALLAHITEEWFWFPEWATRHFGTTSPRFFAVSHVPIVALAFWVTIRATRAHASKLSTAAVWFIIAALSFNGAFHLITTFMFSEYSPGLATAVLFYFPLLAYLGPRVSAVLGFRQTFSTGIAGALVGALITSSLLIDMPTL